MEVYAEKVGDNFTKLKIKKTVGPSSFTYEFSAEEAQHLFDVLSGKCGVMEFRKLGEDSSGYTPPRQTIYASRLHRKGTLEYTIEPI